MSADAFGFRDPKDDTDVHLLSAATAGERPAWEALYERYGDTVYRMCRKSGLAAEDAEDVSQEVFWTVYKGLEHFERRTDGSFCGWLYRICERRIADHQRTFARRRLRAVAADLERLPDRAAQVDPAELQLALAMHRVRSQISEATWAIFDAYVLQGRSADEIARERSISRHVVYHARARMVWKLRAELAAAAPAG